MSPRNALLLPVLLLLLLQPALTGAEPSWKAVPVTKPYVPRAETSFTKCASTKLCLLGGRGVDPVSILDTATRTWSQGKQPPQEIHHFQAFQGPDLCAWVVGAWTGPFPAEDTVDSILKYCPDSDQWLTGPPIDRPRGAGGAVLYKGAVYLVSGNVGGHNSQARLVSWFDKLDLETEKWSQLPDVPHPRDHFHTVILGNKLYVVGGRDSSGNVPDFFDDVEDKVDVFDFDTEEWSTIEDFPRPRAGGFVATLDEKAFIMGGEGANRAWEEVDVLDGTSFTTAQDMPGPRHGTGAVSCNGAIWVAGGVTVLGGGEEAPDTIAYFDGDEPPACTASDSTAPTVTPAPAATTSTPEPAPDTPTSTSESTPTSPDDPATKPSASQSPVAPESPETSKSPSSPKPSSAPSAPSPAITPNSDVDPKPSASPPQPESSPSDQAPPSDQNPSDDVNTGDETPTTDDTTSGEGETDGASNIEGSEGNVENNPPDSEAENGGSESDSDNDESGEGSNDSEESPTPTPDTSGPACFPSDAVVELRDGQFKSMAELQIGDEVRIGTSEEYSTVFFFSHRHTESSHPFVRIQTSHADKVVTLSPGHLLYANGRRIRASEVRVGDQIKIGHSQEGATASVTAVDTTVSSGLHNPHTLHGDIVVNGVITSTFTSAVNPVAAQLLLTPFRLMYKVVGAHRSMTSVNKAVLRILEYGYWREH